MKKLLLLSVILLTGCISANGYKLMWEDFRDPTPSSENREGKKYETLWGGFGSRINGLGANSIMIGKYLDSDRLVEIEIGAGEGSDLIADESPFYGSTFFGGIGYRNFFYNSLFIRGSAHYRELRYNSSRNQLVGYHFKGHRGEVTVSLGSLWQWKQVATGAEVGAIAPMLGTFSEEGLNQQSQQFVFADRKDRFSSHPDTYFRVYFGWSF